MSSISKFVAEARKFLVVVAGLIATLTTYGQLSGSAAKYAAAVLAVLTALGAYGTPNRPPTPAK